MADRVARAGTLLFDGDCGFCTSAAGAAARIAPHVTVLPWQRADLDAFGVRPEAAAEELQWVQSDGRVYGGGVATARFLVAAGKGWKLIGWLLLLPGVSLVTKVAYKVVAANRHRLPGATPACRAD
ncbi:MAG: thiol-disulfide oxidoreductase DCC family protein [Actinomycetes bacterium]